MAGGMGARGGLPMSQRVRLGARASDDGCPARHCWVADAVDGTGVKRPGLLVEWREGAAGWEGRVVYVAALRADGWAVVEEWLPASLLTPR
jgi:hypothetical protein